MTDLSYLDGNMLDGPLRELLAVDLSATTGRCDTCGTTGPMAGRGPRGGRMTDLSYLDGNMLDGPLRELLAVDLSA
ncbi:hypothetical protein DRA43_21335, partial [Micromonospora provocatoris]